MKKIRVSVKCLTKSSTEYGIEIYKDTIREYDFDTYEIRTEDQALLVYDPKKKLSLLVPYSSLNYLEVIEE